DIPAEYSSVDGNIRLMAIGKIHDAGEGCACAMGSLNRIFLEHLVLEEGDVCIVDTEAGVEHFGRGVDKFADAILMVADPSYESIMLTDKITEMAETFGKPVYIVLNKVDADQEAMMRETIKNSDKIIAALPADKGILAAGLKGEALTAELPEVDAIKAALTN
ncbi:MAG: ATP-binding protein, partial [Clostridia bacterium]|nr:ATP-binding protein [Clostridia bacterium]